MDILAALKKEESKLQQQLAIVHTAMKLVDKERKSSDGKKKGLPASDPACLLDPSME